MRPLPIVLAGLSLGTAAALALRHLSTLPSSRSTLHTSSAQAPASAPIINHQSLIINNPRLAPAEAASALDAWLALGAPSDGSAPPDLATQSATLRALLTVLPTDAFSRLLSTLAAREGEDAVALRQIAFEVWTERAPAEAARWAATFPLGPTFDTAARARFCHLAASAWAALDLPAALAWADTLPDGKLRQSVALHVILRLVETDPARAFAVARERGPEFLRPLQSDLLTAWSKTSPADALRALAPLMFENNPHSAALQTSLAAWFATDAPAAFTWLSAQTQLDPQDFRHRLFGALEALPDPRTAIDFLDLQPGLPERTALIGDLVGIWIHRDSTAAFAWLEALPDAARRLDILERSLPDFSDPRKADDYLALVLRQPAGAARDAILTRQIARWAHADPAAALVWLRAHDDPALGAANSHVEGVLLGALAATDLPAALTRWKDLPDGTRSEALPRIASAWTRTDPAAAARWLGEALPPLPAETPPPLSAEQLQNQLIELIKTHGPILNGGEFHVGNLPQEFAALQSALSVAAGAWSQRDPLAALRWAESLPDPTYRAIAIQSMGQTAVPDPAARADYLGQLRDPAIRADALTPHLLSWLQADLPAARRWLESHDLVSPEDAARLLFIAQP